MEFKPVFEDRFLNVYNMELDNGRHYLNASRRKVKDLAANKDTSSFKEMLPDAVSLVVILNIKGEEPKLLLDREFRYPCGQFLLSVPAGLIDPEDKMESEPLFATAKREILEETGIELTDSDTLKVINPLLFSSPGFTDESNAIVLVVLNRDEMPGVSQDGAVGTEKFDGFLLLDEAEARRILCQGTDDEGIFYSVFTWIGLMSFVSGLWRDL